MKIEEFRVDYFRDDEEISVNCLWLQELLKNNETLAIKLLQEKENMKRLLSKVNTLETENWSLRLKQPLVRKLEI